MHCRVSIDATLLEKGLEQDVMLSSAAVCTQIDTTAVTKAVGSPLVIKMCVTIVFSGVGTWKSHGSPLPFVVCEGTRYAGLITGLNFTPEN